MAYTIDEEIKSLALFSELTPDEWKEIFPLLHRAWLIEGEQLAQEGEMAHTLDILLKGHLMIHFRDGRAITIERKGDIIGWSSVISPFQYTANVTSLTEGEVLALPGGKFLELLQSNAAIGEKLLKKINETIAQRRSIRKKSDELKEAASVQ